MGDLEYPCYWMYETSGVLRPAVEAYLAGAAMSPKHVAAMRAYLRQWIAAPVWGGDADIRALRSGVDQLVDRRAIDRWLRLGEQAGIDPL